MYLEKVNSPSDLKKLTLAELEKYAEEEGPEEVPFR